MINFFTQHGHRLELPPVFGKRLSVPAQIWLVLTGDVINVAATYNLVSGASTGWTTLTAEKNIATNMSAAKFAFLAARKKPGAVTALLDNRVTLKVNAVELARIYAGSDGQAGGWTAFVIPGEAEDNRWNLVTGGTGDLAFALDAPDPALELQLIIGGTT